MSMALILISLHVYDFQETFL